MPRQIKGRELLPGDRVQLDDGTFAKVTQLVRAPIKLQFDDGRTERPRWAYFSDGGHSTVCDEDEVTVQ